MICQSYVLIEKHGNKISLKILNQTNHKDKRYSFFFVRRNDCVAINKLQADSSIAVNRSQNKIKLQKLRDNKLEQQLRNDRATLKASWEFFKARCGTPVESLSISKQKPVTKINEHREPDARTNYIFAFSAPFLVNALLKTG
jgi:hypothetical protein